MKIKLMNILSKTLRTCTALNAIIIGLGVMCFSDALQARELRLDQSIGNAMRNQTWRNSVVNGIEFRFGSDPQFPYSTQSGLVPVDSFARTFEMRNGRSVQREDAQVCDEAFRNALGKAAEQARKAGANAVVNITSKFLDTPLNSKGLFACNSGTGSATVDLVVQFATLRPEDLKVTTLPMLPMAKLPGAPAERIYPPATQRGVINEADAIPYIGAGCRRFYTDEWLKYALPRAFAISQVGYCHSASGFNPVNGGNKDPAIRALEGCSAKANMACQLYAVDNNVVFSSAGISDEDMRPVALK
jgi:uncharacterized protein YbjQ (UPF0145 family)